MRDLKLILILILIFLVVSCVPFVPEENTLNTKGERYNTNRKKRDWDNDIEIIKVRDCEYVFWHNGYGSDMEHYEGCTNPIHYKN
jgi:hypothetical protein